MPSASRLRPLLPSLITLGLLIATLAHVATEYARRHREIVAYTAIGATDVAGVSVRPTGDTRELVLPLASMDSHWWIMHAEQLAATGRLVRHTDRDNPPAGRAVHWSSVMTLPLAATASLLRHFDDVAERDAIQQATFWLGPALLLLVLSGLFLVTLQRLGAPAAAILVAALGSAPAFLALFAPGEVDHHGLATTAALMSVWLLSLGLGRPDPNHARHASAAGVAGACGLWISAATVLPILVFTALGALLAAWARRPRGTETTACAPLVDPSPWRIWGDWGAVTALFLYAFEYLPGHASWRLEVNHPLYALAWWGGAAWLARLIGIIGKLHRPATACHGATLAALQSLALILPLVLFFFGGRNVFCLGDSLLWSLHRDYIQEFRPLPFALVGTRWLALPWLWLVVIWAGYRLRAINRSAPEFHTPLILLISTSGGMLLMTGAQVRWNCIATALCAGLAAVCWRAESRIAQGSPSSPRLVFSGLLLLALLQFPLIQAWQRHRTPSPPPDRAELASLVVRDVAWALRGAADPAQSVVLSGPTTSTQLAYFGGFRVLGTLYWENLEGLHAAAAIFASDEQTALQLCQHHRVTHFVIFPWDDFGAAYDRLHGLSASAETRPEATPSLAENLSAHRVPRWLRRLAYDIPPALGLADQRVQIYEVHANQTPLEAHLHLARYQREIGDSASALRTLARAAELIATLGPTEAATIYALVQEARAFGDDALARRLAPPKE